jgi:serine/threonine protein kinase/Tol biopolymer transport system component
MGVVFAARDTRLDRDVAIKALPDAVAGNTDRLARFQREARLLAALSHPHIASIYGLEEIEGRSYLVLEYVDGETLEALLKRRDALPVDETLAIALQIARAIEAAHERGVIHRDLKPANVKINSTGDVKVLDFGLAKALDATSSLVPSGGDATQPPPGSTVTTIPGLVLGSPGYLSPEQARGQPADRRTDVFSFGCLLYEMLTGTSLFAGQSIGDSIGATLYKDPDWTLLPDDTPPTIRLLLRRCLKKDPRQRLHNMADARLDIEEAIADPTGSLLNLAAGAFKPARRWPHRLAPAMFGVVLLGAGLAAGWLGAHWNSPQPRQEKRSVVRFEFFAPPDSQLAAIENLDLNSMAMSPDGNSLVFLTLVEGQSRVWIRDIASGEQREIPAARGGGGPFFSPDGRWLGFYQEGRILKVSLDGGPATPLCRVPRPNGRLAWLKSGQIVFTGSIGQGLFAVSDQGGEPRQLADVDREGTASGDDKPILGYGGVQPLPDGIHVLSFVWNGSTLDDYEIVVVNTQTGEVKHLLGQAAMPTILDSGILIFLRNATLLAVRFDLEQLAPIGQPVPVLEGILSESWGSDAQFALSSSGNLAYSPGGRTCEDRRLIRIDPEGTATPLTGPDAFVGQLTVSPDGKHLALSTLRRRLELWVYDLERRTMSLVSGDGEPYEPVWSPDGARLAYTLEGQNPGVVAKEAFSSAAPQRVLDGSGHYPSSWAPDGTLLLSFQNWQNGNLTDIVALPMDPEPGQPTPVISTPASEGEATVSPDGRWMLYMSSVSGKGEVYLTSFPYSGRSWQVSVGGGFGPMWGPDDRIYYISEAQELLSTRLTVAQGGQPQFTPAEKLFALKPLVVLSDWGSLAALPDGGFLGLSPAPWEAEPTVVKVVVNWGEEVAAKLGQP